jgi:hypothetical protein
MEWERDNGNDKMNLDWLLRLPPLQHFRQCEPSYELLARKSCQASSSSLMMTLTERK